MSAESGQTRRWAIAYKLPSGHSTPRVWAVITGVPVSVNAAGVREALESWQYWPSWQRRVGIGGRLLIVREGTRTWSTLPAAAMLRAAAHDELPWSDLAPSRRRMTLDVDSPLWGRVRAAAASEGVSIRAWLESAVLDKLGGRE